MTTLFGLGTANNSMTSNTDGQSHLSLISDGFEQQNQGAVTPLIKKLNKKDPITKTKALQELRDLVNSSSSEEIIAIIAIWARFYRTLATDPNHKVRETAQVVQAALMFRCGRDAAPYLKQLVPVWLMSQYDTYTPAAAAAQSSLEKTFSKSKLPEVVAFCKSEIIELIVENINSTGESSVGDKCHPQDCGDGAEVREQRVLASGLQCLELFIMHLPESQIDWLWPHLDTIIKSNTFWKFPHHKSSLIRGAWFGCIGALLEKFSIRMVNEELEICKRTARCLTGALGERDGTAAERIWPTLLILFKHIPNWHIILDKKTNVTKKLLEAIENGGWGAGSQLALALLPLLSTLPPELLPNYFHSAFFNAIINGLCKKAAVTTKKELSLWSSSMSECLIYMSMHHTDNDTLELVTSVHRTWLERILDGPHQGRAQIDLIEQSAYAMTAVVGHWLKQSIENDQKDFYDHLVRNFWQNICCTIIGQMEKSGVDVVQRYFNGHLTLLKILKCASFKGRRKRSVRFQSSDKDDISITDPEFNLQTDDSIPKCYFHHLNRLGYTVCSEYLRFAINTSAQTQILELVQSLLNEFNSKEMFTFVAQDFSKDSRKHNNMSLYDFYEEVLKPRLAIDDGPFVDIIFLFIHHLEHDDQIRIFNSFNSLNDGAIERCLLHSLKSQNSHLSSTRRWWGSPSIRRIILGVCKRILITPNSNDVEIVLASLGRESGGDMLMGEEVTSGVMSLCIDHLKGASVFGRELNFYTQVVRILSEPIAAGLCSSALYTQLIFQLFLCELNIQDDVKHENPNETLIADTWRSGLRYLPNEDWLQFVEIALVEIRKNILQDVADIYSDNIEHAVALCFDLSRGDDFERDITVITEKAMYFPDCDWDSDSMSVEEAALSYDCLMGNINCPFEEDIRNLQNKRDMTKSTILTFLNIILFRSLYMKDILFARDVITESGELECDQTELDKAEMHKRCSPGIKLLKNDIIEKELLSLLHDVSILNTILKGDTFWLYCDIVKNSAQIVKQLIKDIIDNLESDDRQHVYSSLCEEAAASGFYWSLAKYYYERSFMTDVINATDGQLNIGTNSRETFTGHGYFHYLQATLNEQNVNLEQLYKGKFAIMMRSFFLAHMHEPQIIVPGFLNSCLQESCPIDLIVDVHFKHEHIFLFNRDIADADWTLVVSNSSVADALTALVKYKGASLPRHHWDFIMIAVCSLIQTIEKSKLSWNTTKVVLLWRSAFALYEAVNEFVHAVSGAPPPQVASLPQEWRDVFTTEINQNIYKMTIHIIEFSCEVSVSYKEIVFIDCLSAVLRGIKWSSVSMETRCKLPLERLAHASISALETDQTHYSVKCLSHILLSNIRQSLTENDAEKWHTKSARFRKEFKEDVELSLHKFKGVLLRLQEKVYTALGEFRSGLERCETISLEYRDHSIILGYLLIYENMLRQCSAVQVVENGDLHHQYNKIFKENTLMERLVCTCLCLLPGEAEKEDDENGSAADLFNDDFLMRPSECWIGGCLSRLSCLCLCGALRGGSASSVRSWWSASGVRVSRRFERLVVNRISPILVREQIHFAVFRHKERGGNDLQLKANLPNRELSCVTHVQEKRCKLQLRFADNHPLGVPKVICTNAPANYAHWVTLYLSSQNGLAWQAIKVWLGKVTKKEEGSLVCPICYCLLKNDNDDYDVTSHCSQCVNTYHNNCAYKWFTSSKKSKCPLCKAHI